MDNSTVIYQTPCPKVVIKKPDGSELLTFAINKSRMLQSYSFSLSKQDITGNFNLTFFPESKGVALWDLLQVMYVVEIYEGKFSQKVKYPIFTGIIKTKKYVTQVTDNGATRRLSVSGTAITGLVSQFYINLDPTAMAVTSQYIENEAVRNGLTSQFLNNKKWKLSAVVETIWKYFFETSNENLKKATTTKIKDYIDTFMDGSPFDIDKNDEIKYKLGCVFNGNATQDFYSIIDGIIPQPVYEKFAYTDMSSGKMKIKIRQVQFDSDKWTALTTHELKATQIKSFDVTQSDNEVYTVFFSYVDGSAIEQDKALKIAAMQSKETLSPMIQSNADKYAIYGYRPLICHFLGYGFKSSENKTDTDIEKDITDLNASLMEWFCKLDEMLNGSISLAMTYEDKQIMPGDVVKFLGGEFYVEGISHNWNYGSNGDINLSVSRGGKYTNGVFSKFEKLTDVINLLQNGVTK